MNNKWPHNRSAIRRGLTSLELLGIIAQPAIGVAVYFLLRETTSLDIVRALAAAMIIGMLAGSATPFALPYLVDLFLTRNRRSKNR
jgi:hypothetical protein